jgi:peroxiredoxin
MWTAMVVVMALLVAGQVVKAESAKVGQKAPGFELVDVTTGKKHSLEEFKGKIVVVRFQSMNCPWDKMRPEGGYERVLTPLAAKYAEKGVVFLAVNSNVGEDAAKLKDYHQKGQISYPLLKDEDSSVAVAYGAKTTPHIFIVDKDGVLRYKGGIEKAPGSPEDCGKSGEQYLAPALDALLAGSEPPVTETVSKGCTIKFKRAS